MVDHIRTLLLNPTDVAGYRNVSDGPTDQVLARFGITGADTASSGRVDRLLPLALAPDLVSYREPFDPRLTPVERPSVYTQTVETLDAGGLYDAVFGSEGWHRVASLFQAADPVVAAALVRLRAAATCKDAPFALGAVLLACAYRRLVLQGGD